MPTLSEILMLAVLPVLLALSGFFSGSETAIFSLSRHERLQMRRAGTLVGSLVARLADEKRLLLITLMLGNMIVNVAFFVVTTILLLNLDRRGTVHALAMTVLNVLPLLSLILFGEVLPKLVASTYAVPWARLTAVPLIMTHRIMSPIRIVSAALVILPLARLIAPTQRPPELSPQELETLLKQSQQRGVLDVEEEQMLQQVLTLSQLLVRDLMTPRVDMIAHDLNDEPAALMGIVHQCEFARIPVYRGDLDHIEGVVFRRQVLLKKPGTRDEITSLVRQVRFVPEIQHGDRLLVELRRGGATLAVAVDEYGGTAGLVTLEDVVEHMVGQIAGPSDQTRLPQIQVIGPGRWRVSADLSVREWADLVDRVVRVPGVSTIGGLVMALLGRAPQIGDRAELGNVTIEVETMDGRRIETLLIAIEEKL